MINIRRLQVVLFSALISIIIIVNSGYYLTTATESYIPFVLLFVLAILLLIKKKNSNFKLTTLNIMLILTGSLVLSIAVNFTIENFFSGLRVLVVIVVSYIFAISINFEKFIDTFLKILRFLTLISLLIYGYILVADSIAAPIISSANNYNYYNLLIVTAPVNHDFSGLRNTSLFWEPGLFGSILIYGLILEIYIKKRKKSTFNVVLFLIAILTTKSTAGILICFLILFGYLIKLFKLNSVLFNIIFISLLLPLVFYYQDIFKWLAELNPNIFSKLIEVDITSTLTRINGPLINLIIFKDNFLFGTGFTDAASLYQNYAYQIFGMNQLPQTSTSTQVLSAIGIGGFVYTIVFFTAPLFNKSLNLSFSDAVIVSTSMLMIVNKEPHIHLMVTWILFFYFINYSNDHKGKIIQN